MTQEVPGADGERPVSAEGEQGDGAASFWLRNLPHPTDAPDEPDWSGLPGLADPDANLSDLWYSNNPLWRRRRLFTLLSVLTFVALLFILVNPLDALQWLAGPEDPPLRVVVPGRLTLEQPGGGWFPLDVGAQVQPGSLLRSHQARTAVLRVRGGGSVRLDAGVTFRVMRLLRREDDSYQIRSMLYEGRAFVRELSTDTLPVETVFTRIQPNNATYEVSHLESQDGNFYTRVRVYSGEVHVGLARGQMSDKVLGAGQSIRVSADRMGEVQPLPVTENDAWEIWNLSWSNTDQIPPFQPSAEAPAPLEPSPRPSP